MVVLLMTSAASAQQAYPTRPIRLIVPYPPGGPNDIIGRTINDRLAKRLGQQVVVDNRAGAATVIDVVHIPYKGSSPAMTDVMGGRCAYMFAGISAAHPHTLSGKLRGLAVSTAKRSAALPEMPTIAESGLPGYDMNTWNSLVIPRG